MLIQQGARVAERFEIEALAGSGGMGAVYRARDRLSGDVVALKLLHSGAPNLARFRREIRLLGDLRHPGIVRYVDSGETAAGEPYLAMEWLDGETLEDRLARAELSIADSVALARAAAEALAAAHARGVVHRDVKPSNLFLVDGRPDQVKVLDFGVAREIGASVELTRTGGVLGTLAYMAPEQAAGEVDVDARADVFALGLVLYRCVARRPAFSADHPMALLAKLVFEDPAPPSAARPGIPPGLDALVLRMLARVRDARPAGGAAAARELDEVGDLIEPASAPERHAALTQREQRLASAVLARLAPPATETSRTVLFEERLASRDADLVGALRVRSSEMAFLADGTLVVLIEATGAATDLAARAARCALALRSRRPGAALVLATGRVERGDASPSGEVIDRAAALLAAAAPRPTSADDPFILLDEVSAGLLAGRFEVRAEAAGPVLVGERAPGSPEPQHALAPRGAERALPFLGRDRELAFLLDLHEGCVEDAQARAALVTGPAGAGKSRLIAELLERIGARAPRLTILRAHGDPMSEASPLAMITGCVRRAAGIRDGEPLEQRKDKLRAEVARWLPESSRERVAAFLGELLRIPFPDEGWPSLQQARSHPALLAEEMRRAFEEYVEAACAAGPVILVAEDIHWADAPSLRYVDGLLRRLARRPLFVLALARPEVHEISPRLWADRDLTEIRLRELRARAAEEIVRAALGPDVAAPTVSRIVDRAGGNAFYLEQLIRAVAEGQDDTLPDTVLAMVQARLGTLPAPARAVLRAASVFGEVFWKGSVEALLGPKGLPGAEAGAWIELLVERDVIARRAPSRFPGEEELAFRHALLRDGAHALLTDADRVTGHRLAGAWLEAAGEADAMILAGHYERGGMAERAVQWCLTAAEEAFERDDLDPARAAAGRGLEIARAGAPEVAGLERVLAMIELRQAAVGAEPQPPPATAAPESSYRLSIIPGTHIFVEVCVGRWSRDFTRRYVADFKEAAAPLLDRPWGKLCNLDAWLPTEPDAAEALIDFLKWSIDRGMSCVAYVIANPAARLQARRIIESSNVALMCEFFAAEEEGIRWLRRSRL